MKGLYICGYNLEDSASGVSKKINSQLRTIRKYGLEVEVIDANSLNRSSNYGTLYELILAFCGCSSIGMNTLLKTALKKIENDAYDYIYIRKGLIDRYQLKTLEQIKTSNPNIKIIIEVPTYPYDQENKWYKWPWLKNDRNTRGKMNKCVDRIVTFSKDDIIFGVKTISIMNGIDYNLIPKRNIVEHEGINLLAVAVFSDWHGYDRVLRGMVENKKSVIEKNINLYFVGKGKILENYKSFVEENGIKQYVHFVGEKRGDDLEYYYDIADIGLDAMGRHRVGVFYNSTLKGKEYCAHGLPIISGVETELDSDKIKAEKFYCRIPADESALSMETVCEFYDETRLVCSDEIRNTTQSLFDLDNAFFPVIEYIQQ